MRAVTVGRSFLGRSLCAQRVDERDEPPAPGRSLEGLWLVWGWGVGEMCSDAACAPPRIESTHSIWDTRSRKKEPFLST